MPFGLFQKKKREQTDDVKDFLELQNTIATLKVIALNLQTTADEMEKRVDHLKRTKVPTEE